MPDSAHFMTVEKPTRPVTRNARGEAVLTNGVKGKAKLTICVPCYNDSADPLVAALMQMPEAGDTALMLFDDGSGKENLTRRMTRHVMGWPGPARLITSSKNRGRAHARNRLIEEAKTDWILFLDADMVPDAPNFLRAYLRAAEQSDGPALIAGGFSLTQIKPTRETLLHITQASRSECLPAAKRNEHPGRYVFTSNILVHADILKSVSFDDGYTGWGWEDVDWGLRVAEDFPVRHIENTATHLGLDETDTLLTKFGGSGANFARLAERHPEAVKTMTLHRMASTFSKLPARSAMRSLTRSMARTSTLPVGIRLYALKTYRALEYAEHL